MKPYAMKGRSHGHRVPRVTRAATATPPATVRAETSLTGLGKLKTPRSVVVWAAITDKV